MKTLIVKRGPSTDQGTLGQATLYDTDGTVLGSWTSGELPWRNNEPNYSSIPACTPPQKYPMKWLFSPKHGRNNYHVFGIPGRDYTGKPANVEIHSASYLGDVKLGFKTDLKGCLSLGKTTIMDGKQKILTGSKESVSKFESLMNGEDGYLIVENA